MSDPFLSQISIWAFNFAPAGYAFCDGQILPISSNNALFSLLGTDYGGDGLSTFGIPDLRGRVPVSYGLDGYSVGNKAGVEDVTITRDTLPSHTHALNALDADGTSTSPGVDRYLARTYIDPLYSVSTTQLVALNNVSVTNTGGGQPHNNMQPFCALNFCISMDGLYPARN